MLRRQPDEVAGSTNGGSGGSGASSPIKLVKFVARLPSTVKGTLQCLHTLVRTVPHHPINLRDDQPTTFQPGMPLHADVRAYLCDDVNNHPSHRIVSHHTALVCAALCCAAWQAGSSHRHIKHNLLAAHRVLVDGVVETNPARRIHPARNTVEVLGPSILVYGASHRNIRPQRATWCASCKVRHADTCHLRLSTFHS